MFPKLDSRGGGVIKFWFIPKLKKSPNHPRGWGRVEKIVRLSTFCDFFNSIGPLFKDWASSVPACVVFLNFHIFKLFSEIFCKCLYKTRKRYIWSKTNIFNMCWHNKSGYLILEFFFRWDVLFLGGHNDFVAL